MRARHWDAKRSWNDEPTQADTEGPQVELEGGCRETNSIWAKLAKQTKSRAPNRSGVQSQMKSENAVEGV